MNDEIYQTLYVGEDGDITSLDEVQLLDEFSQERIDKLIELLDNEDSYIAYQAMLILSAWGIEEGLNRVNEFIANRPDKWMEFEPHRIYDEDNVYDVLAKALYISTFNTNDEDCIVEPLKKLLALYGEVFFESKLKDVLIELTITSSISEEIEVAMQDAIESRRYYQASQLLPVLFKISPALITHYLPIFAKFIDQDNRINYNLEEIYQDNNYNH